MAQRKAKKPKRKAGKAAKKRTAPRRKPARKAPRRAAGSSRSAADVKRIAELEDENRSLRAELDSLRGERSETEIVEPPEPDEGTDSFE